MKLSLFVSFVFALFISCSELDAQEVPQMPEPSEQHQWLQQFVGKWDCQSEATMGPGQPPITCKGTMNTRSLGGFWILNEIKNEVGGATVTGVQTIGYDSTKKKYVGTWVDSMMDHMWKYEGSVEESGKKLTLYAEGPNLMAEGKQTQFRDSYEFKSPDHIIATSEMQGEDGKWMTFMTGNFHRHK